MVVGGGRFVIKRRKGPGNNTSNARAQREGCGER